MLIKKNQYPVLAVNVIAVTLYGAYFLSKQNYEFVLYILVIVFFLLLILFTNKHIGLSNWSLWGLTIWGILHMSGGGIVIGDHVLYKQMIFTISETYEILKFDQFVHAFGFGIATLVVYELLKPMMREIRWGRFSLVVVMAGLGLGALNEIVEFFATVILPETGVGGYINTSLDLVFNLLGALIAMGFIYWHERKKMAGLKK